MNETNHIVLEVNNIIRIVNTITQYNKSSALKHIPLQTAPKQTFILMCKQGHKCKYTWIQTKHYCTNKLILFLHSYVCDLDQSKKSCQHQSEEY